MKFFLVLAGISLSVFYAQAAPPEQSLPTRHVRMPLQRQASTDVSASATATLPTWQGTDSGYTYTIVGQNPNATLANPTLTISVPVVPLKLVFSDGTTFDPTAADNTCSSAGTAVSLLLQSPLFNNFSYAPDGTSVGSTQYEDFFARANFWKYTNPSGINPNYHLLFTPAVLNSANPITINVPAADGKVSAANCGKLGQVDIGWFDNYLQSTVYPQAGILPSELPVFLLYNVATYDPSQPGSYILGYHSAFASSATGNAIQVYAVGEFDTTGDFGVTKDVSDLTHELGEALNDPTGGNPTPAWGNVGQVSGCQTNLEVGDPLSGTDITVTMTNGYTYHLQELAFVSWFYHDSSSTGVNGWYSSNGTFLTSATPCGGTANQTTISLTLSSTTAGSQTNFTAVVSPASSSVTASPTGSVTLVTSTGASFGPYTLNDSKASGTITLPAGTYTIVADYAGSSTFAASASASVAIAPAQGPLKATVTTFSVGATALPQGGRDSITIQVTPASGAGTPTGSVKLVSSTSGTLASFPLTNGTASGSVNLPAGTYTITAEYSGDSTYAASNAAPVTINPATTPALKPTVTTLSLSSTTGGAAVTATIHVAPSTATGTPTGSVNLVSSTSGPLATLTLTNGAASGTVNLPAGNYTVTAEYSGDSTYAASNSTPATISPATPALKPAVTTLSLSSTTVPAGGATVTATIHVTPATATVTGTPTGSVNLVSSLGATLATFTLTNGAATGTVNLPAGNYTVTAQYGGDATFAASSSSPVTINAPTTLPGRGSLTLSATSLAFGSAAVGTTTAAQTITVTNTGTGSPAALLVAIVGADPLDFTRSSSCSFSLAAGKSCSIQISFHPTTAGARTASLAVGGLTAASQQEVTLTGTGTGGPQLKLGVSSLNFGSSNVGTATAAQTVTLSNTGAAALTGLFAALNGANPRDFTGTSTCGLSVAPGASCAISLEFQPTAAGTRTASLEVLGAGTGAAQVVTLTGTGVGGPQLTLSPTSLTFAATSAGTSAPAQTITVSNPGTSALTALSILVEGGGGARDFAQTNNCGFSLAAGGTCAIQVTFTPRTTGTQAAVISVGAGLDGLSAVAVLSGPGK